MRVIHILHIYRIFVDLPRFRLKPRLFLGWYSWGLDYFVNEEQFVKYLAKYYMRKGAKYNIISPAYNFLMTQFPTYI